ncbi:hypothetical protein PR202_ga22517 [Eleusine coracana subsp. coracana]|uniref:Uncharacterized protein n=1 Tax=Eleusine coracana subsp. coracana TaxID=191504 RepID=A0AAV5D1Y3_ELECO|nr:hypothetical protein PR202_ga22517 [Eleusine coracana subsp. coracana]
MGVGDSVESSVFTAGGHGWKIICFPEGSRLDCAGWVSLFLHLERTAVDWEGDVKAKFEFCLLDEMNGDPVLDYQRHSTICTFSLDAGFPPRQWGSRKFIRRKTLEWLYLRHDVLRIRCLISVVGKEATVRNTIGHAESLAAVIPPAAKPRDLHHHLGHLLDSKLGTDVTFMVNGELFPAHRIMLAARSPVFMAELFGQMKEKHMAYIQIDDMDARVFWAMLHFIYTDSHPEMDERDKVAMAQHLIVAADRYNLEKLKLICTMILLRNVDARNVSATLLLAEQHGFYALKEGCFRKQGGVLGVGRGQGGGGETSVATEARRTSGHRAGRALGGEVGAEGRGCGPWRPGRGRRQGGRGGVCIVCVCDSTLGQGVDTRQSRSLPSVTIFIPGNHDFYYYN